MKKLVFGAAGAIAIVSGATTMVNANEMERCVDYKEQVTTARLNVRTGPSTSHGVITTVDKNTSVLVLQEGNGWSKVLLNAGDVAKEKIGHVSNKYLSDKKSEVATGKYSVTATKLNLRSAAGTTSYARIKGSLQAGDTFNFVERTSPAVRNGLEWREIKVVSSKDSSLVGAMGWVAITHTNAPSSLQSETQKPALTVGSNTITATRLNMRYAAGTDAAVAGTLSKGDTVTPVQGVDARISDGLEWRYVTVKTSKNSLVGKSAWVAVKYTNITATVKGSVANHNKDNCGSLADANKVHTGRHDSTTRVTTKDLVVYEVSCEHANHGRSIIIPAGTTIEIFESITTNGDTLVHVKDASGNEQAWYMKTYSVNNSTVAI